jgi:hypothetical protein
VRDFQVKLLGDTIQHFIGFLFFFEGLGEKRGGAGVP